MELHEGTSRQGGFHQLKHHAACALLLESLYNDAGDLWRSFKAALEQVDDVPYISLVRGTSALNIFAKVCHWTPLRNLILQKLGAEAPVPRSAM